MRLCAIAIELRVDALHRGTSPISARMESIESARCDRCGTLLVVLRQLRKDCPCRPYLLLRVGGNIPMPVECCQQQTDHRNEHDGYNGI